MPAHVDNLTQRDPLMAQRCAARKRDRKLGLRRPWPQCLRHGAAKGSGFSCGTTVAMQGSSRKRKAAEGNAATPTRKAVSAPVTGVFSGCHIVYWHLGHTQHQSHRVRQLGGKVEEGPSRDTTHVVCKPELSAEQLAEYLAACPDHR